MEAGSKTRLYFIAVVPPEPVYTDVWEMKQYVSAKFDSHAALRSPPHITLIPPFRWREEEEGAIRQSMQAFKSGRDSFGLELDGFDCFKPRVIFVRNKESPALNSLQAGLQNHLAKKLGLKSDRDDGRPFHPHMTIAFKDLRKSAFYEAWEEVKDKEYKAQFLVESIALLKHDGKRWEVVEKTEFGA